MTNLTPERLAEIKARCEAATYGPWTENWSRVFASVLNGRMLFSAETSPNAKQDALFTAHARKDVPDLIAEVKRLREDLKLYGEHKDYCGVRWTLESPKREPCDCGLKRALDLKK